MKIEKINSKKYEVNAESTSGLIYEVTKRRDGSWFCGCKSFQYHTNECKHIKAVSNYIRSKWEIFNSFTNKWDKAVYTPDTWKKEIWLETDIEGGYEYWIAWDCIQIPLFYRLRLMKL